MSEKIRIQKYLAMHGAASRRGAELTGVDRYQPAPYTLDPLYFVANLRPVVWHTLDSTEEMMYSSAEKALIRSTDFSQATSEVLQSSVISDREGDETYSTRLRYRIDEHNSFLFDLQFNIRPDRIRIDYSITPEFESLSWVPVYGVAWAPRGLKGLRYVGLGPQDAYPNKCAAPTFGLWPYDSGVKQVRSILCDLWEGTSRIDTDGYLEVDPARPEEVMILGGVVSRPEKGRKAVAPFPLLRTAEDAPFRGSFTLTVN